MRLCSKTGCGQTAVACLTYNYADQTAVLGPLSQSADPHAFDLCELHAESLTVPRGWEVIRLQTKFEPAAPSSDDLLALVEVVREVAGATGSRPVARHAKGAATPAAPEDKHAPPRGRDRFTVVAGEGAAQEESTDSRLGPLAIADQGPLS